MRKYLKIAVSVFLLSCTAIERDNQYDERASNYIGNASADGSSSSVETDNYPSSSSVVSSGGSVGQSSSSVPPSSSSGAGLPSSGSAVPSSSSALPSSSGTAPSSSSVGLSSSSALPSSSGTAPSSSSVEPSSSSAPPSSSSIVPSSSSSSSVGYTGSYGSLDYEGQTYKTVVIGTQTWMAENLNYAATGSKCGNSSEGLSDNNTTFCDTYGRLYNWSTATTVCPPGWHLPSCPEWNTLKNYVGPSTAGTKLKAASGWGSGNGTDDFGFSALPGGLGSGGSFYYVGNVGDWWSASRYSNADLTGSYSYYTSIGGSSSVVSNSGDCWTSMDHTYSRSFLLSVRCVKD